MRKFLSVFLLLSLFVFVSDSLSAQTRPRRVEQPVNAPPLDDDATPADTAPSVQPRRPVLTGNVSNGKSETKLNLREPPTAPKRSAKAIRFVLRPRS